MLAVVVDRPGDRSVPRLLEVESPVPGPGDLLIDVAASAVNRAMALLADRRLHPVVDRLLPIAEVADAHRVAAASEHFGKVVLTF